jgi:tRNA(adenine34) deaminase
MKMTRQERYEKRQLLKKQREEAAEIAAQQKKEEQEREDICFMRQAITQAKRASRIGEVPIGCVIVHEGKVIGRGYNRRNTDNSTLSHAEITAIRRASKALGDWRLEDCTLYVTLEPCQMCAGAIVQARIPRVVMGTMNPKAGCAGSIINLLEMKQFNHQVQVTRGVCGEACSSILKEFFENLRKEKQSSKKEIPSDAEG